LTNLEYAQTHDMRNEQRRVFREMKAVARELGKDILRGSTEEDIKAVIPALREKVGDRAILRALHYVRENERVCAARDALKASDTDGFLSCVLESGRSSFTYLQNVYTTVNVSEQGLSLALALTDGCLKGKKAAFRVHGGGFAGTIQVFLPKEELAGYVKAIDACLGEGSAMPLNIRPVGACKLF